MASKVNTKFVVALAAGAAVVLGGLYIAYEKLVKGTPARLVASGDEQLRIAKEKAAAGDEEGSTEAVGRAISFYSKAVNKEQTNVELLKKWDEALAQYAPASRVEYSKAFGSDFMLIRRQLAVLQQTDIDAHRRYLDVVFEQTNGASVNSDAMIRATEDMLLYFDQSTDPALKARRDGILRYRGIARLQQAIRATDLNPELVAGARADLEAALRYDSKDDQAAEALYALAIHEGERIQAAKPAEAQAIFARADQFGGEFLATNPGNPRLTQAMLRTRVLRGYAEIRRLPSREQRLARQAAIREELKPALEESARFLEAADPKKVDPSILQTFASVEATIEPTARLRRSLAIADKVCVARPEDPELALVTADIAARARDFERALSETARVGAMPVKPIGLEGIRLFDMKRAASGMAAQWAMDLVEQSDDKAQKEAHIARARTLRDAYATYVEASDPNLKFINGRLALHDQKVGEAARLIKEYNEAMGDSDTRGILYAAIAAMSSANPNTGYAKEQLKKVIQREPEMLGAYFQLFQVELANQDLKAAEQALNSLLEIDPQNERAKQMLVTLRGENLEQTNPVAQRILEIFKDVKPGDEAKVLASLRQLHAEHPTHPAVAQALSRHLLGMGERAEAATIANQALAANPDNVALNQLATVLGTTDELEAELKLIDSGNAPRLGKLMQRMAAFQRRGKDAEALAELEIAEREFPGTPEVTESRFMIHLQDGKWDDATRLADIAAQKNMDNADGLTFKARLLAARGQVAEALAAVEAALRLVPANSEMFRLQGKLLSMLGRLEEASSAFKRAVDARATDHAANREYVQSLIMLNRQQEALAHCKQNIRVVQVDAELLSIYLDLEWALGSKDIARQSRERLHRSDPGRRDNALALARIHIDDKKFAEADALVNQVKALGDGLDVAGVEMTSLHAQGKRDEAKAVCQRLIASPDNEVSMQASTTLASYQISLGEVDAGIATMQAARAKQDPKLAQVDQQRLQMFAQLGRMDDAIAVAREMITSTGDEKGAMRKQLVRMLLRQNKLDEADQAYTALAPLESKDPEALLLKADTKIARGNRDEAKFILDDAVARFAQNPLVFNVRGMFFLNGGDARRAIDDFTASLQLNPLQTNVYGMRARAYIAASMSNEALKDLDKVAELAPADQTARRTLVENLLDMGRLDEAVLRTRKLIQANGNDPRVSMEFGDLFGAFRQWTHASEFFKKAYDATKDPEFAAALITSYLQEQPPKTAEAGVVIREMQAQMDASSPLLMAKARWQGAQNDRPGARESLTKALQKIPAENTPLMRFWSGVTNDVIKEKRERLTFLEQLERLGGAPATYARWFRGAALAEDEATRAQGMEILNSFTDPSHPEGLRRANFITLSGLLFATDRSQDGVDLCRKGLEQFPDDPDLLNNIAYTLSNKLGKPAEALPFAERAVKAAPNSPDPYDTLGFVHYLNKDYAKAKQALQYSIVLGQNTANFRAIAIALIHLGNVFHAEGDKSSAKQLADQAAGLMRSDPTQFKDFETDLLELQKKVE